MTKILKGVVMIILKGLVAIVCFACSVSVYAGTLGNQVALRYFYPDLGVPTAVYPSQLVDNDGAHFSNVAGVFDLTVTDTQIIVNNFNTSAYWLPGSFNGFVVSSLDSAFHPVAALGRATNMDGFSLANVSISGNSAYVNWQGLSFDEDTQVVLYISAIPEPDQYILLLAGSCIVFWALRRRNAVKTCQLLARSGQYKAR